MFLVKVRKVDAPKDHMAKEWEEFQKEMRQVNTVSIVLPFYCYFVFRKYTDIPVCLVREG